MTVPYQTHIHTFTHSFAAGFLPSTGRLSSYTEPQTFAARDPYLGDEIRADAGVNEGSEISMFYDPMICKLITHGQTRESALDRLRAALDAYVIRGVNHNVSFLRDLTDHPRFKSGVINTSFIAKEYPRVRAQCCVVLCRVVQCCRVE